MTRRPPIPAGGRRRPDGGAVRVMRARPGRLRASTERCVTIRSHCDSRIPQIPPRAALFLQSLQFHPGAPSVLLRIASCGPPGQHGTRRPRAVPVRCRAEGGPAPGRRTRPGTRRSAHVVRPIRQRSRRSPPATGRPARRCGPALRVPPALTRTRTSAAPSGPGSTERPPGRAGMGCWVRTAADGAAVRTPSDRLGEAVARARPAAGSREAERAGRSSGAGDAHAPSTRRLRDGPDPTLRPASWPWRTLLAAARRTAARPRLPRLRPDRAGRPRPRRTGARRPRGAGPVGALARARHRPGLLRAAAVLDRHLRRPGALAGAGGVRGAAPGPARRRHRPGLPASAAGRCGRRPSGSPTRRCAAVHPRRLPLGPARAPARPRARCCPWPPTAAFRWSPSPSPSPARCWPRPRSRLHRAWSARSATQRPGAPPRSPWAPSSPSRAGGAGLAAAARLVAHRRRTDHHRRRDPGQRAAGRPRLQRPAPRRPRQPRPADPRPRRRRRRGGAGAAGRGALAGEQLRHRSLPQRGRRPADPARGRRGDRRPDPGGRRRPGARALHQQHRDRLGPRRRAGGHLRQAAPGALRRVRAARSFFRIFSSDIDRVTDQHAGDEVGVLDLGGARVGDLICFEVVYDGLVRDVVDGGAGMLVVQTNNATFGYTHESEQQLAMSRLRAVETGRTVAVAATSGISAIVAPRRHGGPLVVPVHPGGLRRGDRPARLASRWPSGSARPRSGR